MLVLLLRVSSKYTVCKGRTYDLRMLIDCSEPPHPLVANLPGSESTIVFLLSIQNGKKCQVYCNHFLLREVLKRFFWASGF